MRFSTIFNINDCFALVQTPMQSFQSINPELHSARVEICVSEVISIVQVTFFLLVRIFPLKVFFIFFSWGNIFWELRKFSGASGPASLIQIVRPLRLELSYLTHQNYCL
jgi:hypothetical protein